jgi:hypothetical protein
MTETVEKTYKICQSCGHKEVTSTNTQVTRTTEGKSDNQSTSTSREPVPSENPSGAASGGESRSTAEWSETTSPDGIPDTTTSTYMGSSSQLTEQDVQEDDGEILTTTEEQSGNSRFTSDGPDNPPTMDEQQGGQVLVEASTQTEVSGTGTDSVASTTTPSTESGSHEAVSKPELVCDRCNFSVPESETSRSSGDGCPRCNKDFLSSDE